MYKPGASFYDAETDKVWSKIALDSFKYFFFK